MNKFNNLFFIGLIGFMMSIQIPLLAQQEVNSGEDVIHLMHERYESKWYPNLTFEQKTTFFGPNEEVQRTQTWYEALKIPGKLAIKFDDKEGGDGILFRDGMQYGFVEGELIQQVEQIHDLLVLGFDVYRQSPETTIQQLQKAGYSLDEWHESEWQGRPVYVVGTAEESTSTPQFWIDKERLVFVKNLKIGRQKSIQEVHFNKYQELGDAWIAPEVILFVNGQKAMLEEYSNITTPDSLDDKIFEVDGFIEGTW